MMKSLMLFTAFLTAVASTAVAQRVGASAFAPAVKADDSVATCAAQSPAVLHDDERGYVLRFGSSANGVPHRIVAATWDTAGHLRRYSDARGDLRGPPVPVAERGEHTSIMIDFTKRSALLVNEAHGHTFGSTLTTPDDALGAEALGYPNRMLERLHTECGAPAP